MVDNTTEVIAIEGGDGVVINGCVGVIDKKSCGISDGVGDGVGVILDLKCDGENCTRYGVRFNLCLADVFLVTEHRMEELSASNHWMNGRLFEFMTNKEKRFVLYGWYAQNIGTGGTGTVGVVCSDEHKREQKKDQRRRALINTVTSFLNNILQKPEIWIRPDLKMVREKCYQITSNPAKYPPPPPAADVCRGRKFSIVLLPYPDFRF